MKTKIGRLNLDTPNETLESAYTEWERRHKSVVCTVSPGWVRLHQVKRKALSELIAIFTKYGVPYRNIHETTGIEGYLLYVVNARGWYKDERFWPGTNERNRTVEQLLHAKSSGAFVGIDPERYDELLGLLDSMPDKPDIHGFNIDFCIPEV